MENLDQIKNSISEMELQLDALKAQLESAEEKSHCTYSFTQDEMIQFVTRFHEHFVRVIERNINRLDFEEAVELELYDRNIEITVRNNAIGDIITSEFEADLDEDAILATITHIVTDIKNNQ